MKKNSIFLAGLASLALVLGLAGCPTDSGTDPVKYTVTFDANGGSAVSSVKADSGGTLGSSLPADPTQAGYVFGGGFTEANGGGTEFTASTQVTGNITVYAKWTAQSGGGEENPNGPNYETINGVKYTAPEITNALLIGIGTASTGLGKAWYIGNTSSHTNPTIGYSSMAGYELKTGSNWSGTATWASSVTGYMNMHQIKKNGKLVAYSDLPDYSVPDAAGKHFQFWVDCVESQNDGTEKNFFGIIPDGYTSANVAGGVLYHWTWNSTDKTIELGNSLIQKGYSLTSSSSMSNAMTWHGTRVEMNTISSPRYYSVEYFDGTGNMQWANYSAP
jgi:uncharacterized repeat protein (TIGR02543 family)